MPKCSKCGDEYSARGIRLHEERCKGTTKTVHVEELPDVEVSKPEVLEKEEIKEVIAEELDKYLQPLFQAQELSEGAGERTNEVVINLRSEVHGMSASLTALEDHVHKSVGEMTTSAQETKADIERLSTGFEEPGSTDGLDGVQKALEEQTERMTQNIIHAFQRVNENINALNSRMLQYSYKVDAFGKCVQELVNEQRVVDAQEEQEVEQVEEEQKEQEEPKEEETQEEGTTPLLYGTCGKHVFERADVEKKLKVCPECGESIEWFHEPRRAEDVLGLMYGQCGSGKHFAMVEDFETKPRPAYCTECGSKMRWWSKPRTAQDVYKELGK